jgi:hypothetical protein
MNRVFILMIVATAFLSGCKSSNSGEWQTMFDGKTLDGWKPAAENPASFTIEDGAIKASGARSHLFFNRNFRNFEFETEIKTLQHSNSGIFIHTAYQPEGWPSKGYEIQVNNSYRGNEKNPERRKTGSIYNIRNIYYPLVNDNEWFKMRIKVVEHQIEIFVNDVKVNDYNQPPRPWRWQGGENVLLSAGTIALQAHDPGSTAWYRNLKIRKLADGKPETLTPEDDWDTKITQLMKAGFPFIDYHVHLKGTLTIDSVLQKSQQLGINYGIAPNCGLHFPVTNDSSLYAYLNGVKNAPVFKGMQAEGREWITLFSPEAVGAFDYVFTDAMTFTDIKGRRNRIWIPEEVWVDDKQQFMDMLVGKIEAIFSQEPVDIYVNPTVLPAALMPEYEMLWTKERMTRVVKILADNNIALEINARYKVPKPEMIKMAKEAGVKFTFGTNNTGNDLGNLEYCLKMIEEVKLVPNDMFEIKPDSLKPVKIKGLPDKITG